MSRGMKSVLAVAAAVLVPVFAPAMAAAIGVSSTLGTAMVGAGLGAASAAATGGNPLLGAALGGFGTYAAGGGFDNLFKGAGAAGANAPPTGAGAGVGATTATHAGAAGAGAVAGGGNVVGAGAGVGATTATHAGAAGAGAAGGGGLSGFFRQVGEGMLNNPAGMAQLALTVYGAPPQNLTPQELAQLEELKGLAETNRGLFEQRVQQANQLIQMAGQQAPNPEQAFAQTKIAAERQLGDQTRGLTTPEMALERRRSAIRSTQAGATAAAAEEARGRGSQIQLMQAGYNMLPSQAPQGYAGLSMPIWQSLQDRRDQYIRDLARGAGDVLGGQRKRDRNDEQERRNRAGLFGNIFGST
jgi:hypothetical protein